MSTSPTTNYGWLKPNVGTELNTWGGLLNAIFDAIDAALKGVSNVANSASAASCTTGMIAPFDLAAAPAGWVQHNGQTIGNAASNATGRANADTLALFTAMWAFTNTQRPVYTSAGVPSTRGASAADDFAANKQILLGNSQSRVIRGAGGGLGPALGNVQEDAMQSYTSQLGLIFPGGTASGGWSKSAGAGAYSVAGAAGSQASFDLAATSARTAAETRVKSYGALICIKL